jgi:hypothetical protein
MDPTALAEALYQVILGRHSDPGGLEATVNAIKSGNLAARILDMLGSPEYQAAHGGTNVPPATGQPGTIDSLRGLIAADVKLARGSEATDADYAYWLPKLQGDMDHLDYWHKRLLGWEAGGADVAKFGPYAPGGRGDADPESQLPDLEALASAEG